MTEPTKTDKVMNEIYTQSVLDNKLRLITIDDLKPIIKGLTSQIDLLEKHKEEDSITINKLNVELTARIEDCIYLSGRYITLDEVNYPHQDK